VNHAAVLVLGLLIQTTAWSASPGVDDQDPDNASILARAHGVVGGMLSRLPNYTCQETLERSERDNHKKPFQMIDRIRLEVAFVDGKELYARAGSKRFDDSGLTALMSGHGAMGTGDFGAHLGVSYGNNMPFTVAGKERWKEHEAWRLTQQIPFERSQYIILMPPAKATAAYTATAWHDARTFELLRFELNAREFRPKLPLRSTSQAMEYATVEINGRPVRLPSSTEVLMITRGGRESRTVSTFSDCREYVGESKLTFDDTDAPGPAVQPPPPPAPTPLPRGAEVKARLDSDIDLRKAAAGDTVTMTVTKDAVRGATKLLSAGARLHARWKDIECHDVPTTYCFARIDLESYTDGERSGPAHGYLQFPDLDNALTFGARAASVNSGMQLPQWVEDAPPGTPILFTSLSTKLPRGYTLIWRTLEVSGGSTP